MKIIEVDGLRGYNEAGIQVETGARTTTEAGEVLSPEVSRLAGILVRLPIEEVNGGEDSEGAYTEERPLKFLIRL